MFRMLTCFKLQAGVQIGQFSESLDARVPAANEASRNFTDKERDHEYFFMMNFSDRAQCDQAVDYMYQQGTDGDVIHRRVYAQIEDPVFICWEDIAAD